MNAITEFPSTLRLGLPQTAGPLTMVPLMRREPPRLRYLPFGEALMRKLIDITEISDGGSVPEVRVENRADLPVLFLDGDALVGAKQNRVLNLTVLVAAQSTTLLPVSCVEAGRWASRSRAFSEGDSMHFARARAAKMASVSRTMNERGEKRSDQGEVWRVMASYGESFASHAPSGAMQDIFESVRMPTEDIVHQMKCTPDQCGAAFVVNGWLIGIDALSSPEAFNSAFGKLARSYAVESQVRDEEPREVRNRSRRAQALVYEAFAAIVGESWREHRGVGLGTDLRLTSDRMDAGALVQDDEVLHLAAFPRRRTTRSASDNFAGPMPRSRRRGEPL